jgi:hypothetical protein
MSNDALVDIVNEDKPGDLDQLRRDLSAAGDTKPAPKAKPDSKEEPKKYRGKSRDEIMEMHQNAERKIGQTGNELGQYKTLTDQLLDLKRRDDLAKGGAEVEEEEPLPKITQTEILDDPDAAISRAIDARLNKSERKQERLAEETQAAQLQTAFATRHPDANEIAQTEEFQEFVTQSPSRQMLAAAALNAGNLYAANVLLDEWKAQDRSDSENDHSEIENKPLEEARRASTLSTGASNTGDAPTGKVYRRLDLIRLKLA